MSRSYVRAAVAALCSFVFACSAFVSLDGLSGGNAGLADGGDAALASESGPADAATDASDPSVLGLIAYWKFDETSGTLAHDSSGNGNDGTLQTGATWAPGKIAGAVSLDGVSGEILVTDSPKLDVSSTATFAMWMNLTSVAAQPRLLTKSDTYDIKLNGGSPQLTTNAGYAIAMATLTTGSWHHVAFTFSNGTVRPFVDGAEVTLSTNTMPVSAIDPGTGLTIGSYGSSEFTAGLLDEIRIYDRVLDPTEIAALAQ